ncbi:Flp family type IVb pilin [Paracoccus sp. S-4012]|uniref:Flp family type IVb pilin n=1 Tax=Paracoccus sp. S-4012 TaxID=2665648 RepID=UPI0012AFD72C|nr:Flp family type IVb pilin [Paracoccus sp. S-4012]MRX51759.1 Flp family type IVb pilin [Paracoccus sp. S-4012]
MKNRISRLVKNESGATAIEYGMIAGLISVVIITILVTIGQDLGTAFQSISDGLKEIPGTE